MVPGLHYMLENQYCGSSRLTEFSNSQVLTMILFSELIRGVKLTNFVQREDGQVMIRNADDNFRILNANLSRSGTQSKAKITDSSFEKLFEILVALQLSKESMKLSRMFESN